MTEERRRELVAAATERWEQIGTDRARSGVFSGVEPAPIGKDDDFHASGRGDGTEVPHQSIVVHPPALGREIRGRPQDFDPIRIGYLVDIDTGSLLGDCLDAAILAIEDTMNEGRSFRPVEIVLGIGQGLPRRAARHTIAAYEELCDAGCLAIIGPYTTDGAMAILPTVERRGVPCVSANGAKNWHSRYGFSLGNGGVSEEGAIMADWCRGQGHRRVGTIVEDSPGGAEYSLAFRLGARYNRLDIAGEITCATTGAGLAEGLRHLRDTVRPDVLVYNGYGYPVAMINPLLDELDWHPPRIQSTAFMWYINVPSMLEDLEGWVGIDQVGDDVGEHGNPNYWPMVERFEHRFGRRTRHAMICNTYDTMRAILTGVEYAPLLTPEGVVEGLEKITMLPVTVGGPSAYISFGPWDRKGYKGEFLTLRRVEDGHPHPAGGISRLLPSTIDGSTAQ